MDEDRTETGGNPIPPAAAAGPAGDAPSLPPESTPPPGSAAPEPEGQLLPAADDAPAGFLPPAPEEAAPPRPMPTRRSSTEAHRCERPPDADRAWSVSLTVLVLLGILLIGGALRLTDLQVHGDGEAWRTLPQHGEWGRLITFGSWDDRMGLHPDERFLTMVEQAIAFPEPCRGFVPYLRELDSPPEGGTLGACLTAYLDTANSTLNPRNRGHGLFVYGYLPILLVRTLVESLQITSFADVTLAGRVLSALTDLATVLGTFFLGRRLYGRRVGLLAALLLSLSVLNIQNAHFFTVDIFASLMTLLCVYLAVVLAEGKGSWGTFALLGLAFGAAVASKFNTAAFALIIALAGGVRVWRRAQQEGDRAFGPALRRTAAGLAITAVLALLVFRLAQPYAFQGPHMIDLDRIGQAFQGTPEGEESLSLPRRLLNAIFDPRYLENLGTVQGLVSGEIDYPPSHQWTDRAPLWFPWRNMVVWGMGLPLGLAAWAGVVLAGWKLVRKKDLRPLIPLAWTLFLFLYQGMQFVKTMRYFLPLYPLLCIFAAYLISWLWDRARQAELRPRWRTVGAGTLIAVVVGGSLLWAWGYVQIYRRPITRIAASRWIYQNIPTDQGALLQLADGGELPVAIPNAQRYYADGPATTTLLTPSEDVVAVGLTVTHLEDSDHSEGEEALEVTLSADVESQQILAQGVIRGDYDGPAGDAAPGQITFPPLPLQGGQTYYLRLQSLEGTIRTWAVALANEQWDDPLPMRVDGNDGFSIYRGLDLHPYAEDTPEKIDDLLHQLANTDYLILSSNRLYDSIPRLPMRYPVTTRYYRALFDGSLGFERVATFTSYITLFAGPVPDGIAAASDEERGDLPGWEIPDRSAEEAFSVYDHPTVLIYRRTEAYDPDQAYAMLTAGIDWDTIARIRPVEVPGYQDLLLTADEVETQRQGGTWSELFNPEGWTNRLSVPVWILLVELLGLAVFPLTQFLVGRLADGGFLPAKALGILLLGYLSWILAASKLLPFTRWTIALALGLLLFLGGLVAWRRRRELAELLRTRWRLLLLEEALFLGGFLLFLLIRFGNPDLWHPWFGGEKPMDMAYLTAIVRSTTFPPYDPWFAGGYLNYYYFGHVLLATMIKLTGIVPAVAYNLAIPLLYGLLCGGVFTVVYHLVHRKEHYGDGWDRRAIYAGLTGAAFVALLGNLGEYFLILGRLVELSESSFVSRIPGLTSLVRAAGGLVRAMREGLPIGLGSWYWDASRVMPRGEINEFPFFTFLYADLHAHMIALPYTLLVLTQIVAWLKDRRRRAGSFWSLLPPPWALLGLALVVGLLRAANQWDLPTYFLLAIGGWAIVLYERQRRFDWRIPLGSGVLALLLWFSTSLLYAPFWARYGAYYTSLMTWWGERSRVGEYLVIHGLFLFILVSYLLIRSFGREAREAPLRLVGMVLRRGDRLPELTRRFSRWVQNRTVLKTLLWGGVALLLVELFFHLPAAQNPAWAGAIPGGSFLQRLRGQPLLGWLVLLAVMGVVLLLRRRQQGEDRLITLFVLAGLAISGGVELWVLRGDVGRMNTVFKFYLQIWVLFGLSSAAVLPTLWDRLQRWSPGARKRWKIALYILVGLCALYPIFAAPAKINDRFPLTETEEGENNCWYTRPDSPPGLDGAAYAQQAIYCDEHGPIVLAEDMAAIRWLHENVEGSPVILEGHAPNYRWGSRISIYTGLPTVLGWDWHQEQQRAALGAAVVRDRRDDIAAIYSGTDIEQTMALLRQYDVSYIVLGQLERYYYEAEGLAKFEEMVGVYLERVYPEGEPPGNEGLGPEAPLPTPTTPPYPQPATSSVTYPGPENEGGAASAQPPPTGTIIYRVLPAAGESDLQP